MTKIKTPAGLRVRLYVDPEGDIWIRRGEQVAYLWAKALEDRELLVWMPFRKDLALKRVK